MAQGLPPGLRGWFAADEAARQQNSSQLQQLQGILAMRGAMQKQQQEQAYRSALSQAQTPDEQLAVATKFGGPEAVMRHADRASQIKATQETTLARIGQQASQFDQMMQYRYSQAKDANEQRAIENQWKQGRLNFQAASLRMAGAKLYDETGVTLGIPETPQLGVQPAPNAAPQQGVLRTTAPTDAQALQLVQDADRQGLGASVSVTGSPTMPQVAPVAAPRPVTPYQPQDPNADAQDRLIAAQARMAPAGVPAPIPTATVTKPPEKKLTLADAPAGLSPREARKWLMDANKPGAGGAATEAVVDAIVAGRMQVPTGFALRSPYWQDVIERVAKKDPNFDATKYGGRAAAIRTFSSGPEARNVTALNTVIGHLGTLDEAASALQNKDLRAFNSVANRLATELGDPRVQNFDTAKQAVAEETMRVFRQVGASELEARQWGQRITSSGSPQQLRGVISTLGDLLDSRIKAIGQQYERTANQQGNPARVDPENVRVLDRLRGGGTPARARGGDQDLINKYLQPR